MTAQTPEMQVLLERLEKLDRNYGQLKRVAIVAAVLAVIAVASAWGLPLARTHAEHGIPHKLTAHRLEIVDGSGRVKVAAYVIGGHPGIAVYGAEGESAAALSADEGGGGLVLSDTQGNVRLGMGVSSNKANVLLFDHDGRDHVDISVPRSGAPSISLTDSQGFEMDLGSVTTKSRNGETNNTSVASIVLFGNDKEHHPIWRAP